MNVSHHIKNVFGKQQLENKVAEFMCSKLKEIDEAPNLNSQKLTHLQTWHIGRKNFRFFTTNNFHGMYIEI